MARSWWEIFRSSEELEKRVYQRTTALELHGFKVGLSTAHISKAERS